MAIKHKKMPPHIFLPLIPKSAHNIHVLLFWTKNWVKGHSVHFLWGLQQAISIASNWGGLETLIDHGSSIDHNPDNYWSHSRELMHLVPSVRLCVSSCQSIYTILIKHCNLWPWFFFVLRLTLTLASVSLKVKVVGQRSRSNMKILLFSLPSQMEVKGQGHQGQGQIS